MEELDHVEDEEAETEEDDIEHVPKVAVAAAAAPPVVIAIKAKVVPAKKVKGVRKKKDPNAPSAPMSAYAFFFRETQVMNI